MILPAFKMPNWYYDKKDLKNTPSIRDGLDFETDRRYRKEGSRFIMECGTKMGLGHNTMATGVVYFHRFYVFHSFKSFPRYVTACCCLLLAGKVEETPKKCRDIIKIARTMLSDQKLQSFGEDPKEEVMTLERILLQTIKFDLQVEHPYSFLVKYAKCLKGDQVKRQKMVQMAWNFVNDSLTTTVCLQWEPEIIAVALIHLASKLSKFSVTKWDGQQPTHLRWWDMFVADVTMEILEDICHQVLDLYQQSNQSGMDSPPQLPPSKSSPPAKRTKISPTYAKSSPSVMGIPPQPPNLPRPSIDEKLENMPMQRVHQMSMAPSAAYQAAAYAPQPPYGAMFQHAAFGHPPPHVPQPPPPPQPPMYGGGPPGAAGPYCPPQPIPTQYQPGGGVPPHHPSTHPNYYQPMPPAGGRGGGGGYYQGLS